MDARLGRVLLRTHAEAAPGFINAVCDPLMGQMWSRTCPPSVTAAEEKQQFERDHFRQSAGLATHELMQRARALPAVLMEV